MFSLVVTALALLGTQAAAPPTPDESSDDDVPISQLRNQKYSVGDRVEADWKSEGEFFPGAISASHVGAFTPCVVSRFDGNAPRRPSIVNGAR